MTFIQRRIKVDATLIRHCLDAVCPLDKVYGVTLEILKQKKIFVSHICIFHNMWHDGNLWDFQMWSWKPFFDSPNGVSKIENLLYVSRMIFYKHAGGILFFWGCTTESTGFAEYLWHVKKYPVMVHGETETSFIKNSFHWITQWTNFWSLTLLVDVQN